LHWRHVAAIQVRKVSKERKVRQVRRAPPVPPVRRGWLVPKVIRARKATRAKQEIGAKRETRARAVAPIFASFNPMMH